MKIFSNIYLIGTSHIANQSILEVRKGFEIYPDLVAIELDINRAYILEQKINEKKSKKNHSIKEKKIKKNKYINIKKDLYLLKEIGLFGFLLLKVGQSIQNKYGNILNIQPGSEMYEAIKFSKEKNLPIFFIDRDIKTTLNRFSKHLKKREILKILFELLLSPFLVLFKKEKIKFDLNKIPNEKLINFILSETKKSYPSIYRILIDERDLYMAKKLYYLSKKYPEKKILCVCGAGHINGINKYLEKLSKTHADITY